MKKVVTRLIVIVAVTALVAVLSGGCTKKPVIPPESDSQASSSTSSSSYPTADGTYSENNLAIEGTLDDSSSTGDVAAVMDQQSDEYKQMHGRSSSGLVPVYFDFDSSDIRADQVTRIEVNAEFCQNNMEYQVRIEGNTDPRGTNEYNMALGERRALSAKKYLVNLGVDDAKLTTVSYGEERMLLHGHDELSWAQNRRADFVVVQ